jgi:hypothetical protein
MWGREMIRWEGDEEKDREKKTRSGNRRDRKKD